MILENTARALLLGAFFDSLPKPGATEFPDAAFATCAGVVNELTRRAYEARDVDKLRETHTMREEIYLARDMVNAARAASPILRA